MSSCYYQFKAVPIFKDYQDFLVYLQNIQQIQQETNTQMKVLKFTRIIGDRENVQQALQRLNQISNNENVEESDDEFNELTIIKNEISSKTNIFRSEMLQMKNHLENMYQAMEAIKNNFNEYQNAVCQKMAQMSAIVQQELQKKDLIDYVDLDKFYQSSEYIDIPKFRGEQPLHTASRMGRLDVVQKLVRTGMSAYVKDQYGSTPLHYACIFGHLNVVKFLVDLNIPINDQDNFGDTALMKASHEGFKAIVEHMCNKNANVHIENKNRSTALMVASGIDKNQVIKILKKYGAEY